MIEYLTDRSSIKRAGQRIRTVIDGRDEWFFSLSDFTTSSLLISNEISLRIGARKLILSCVTDEGLTKWRVYGWEWTGDKLLLEVTGRGGPETTVIELIPRASARAIAEVVSESRRARCYTMAGLACRVLNGARIFRMALSAGSRRGQPGRDARILLETRDDRIAVTVTVAEDDGTGIDAFLSSALIWYLRAAEGIRRPFVRRLWLVTPKAKVEALSERLAMLRSDLQSAITLFEIDDAWTQLVKVSPIDRDDLIREAPARVQRSYSDNTTKSATEIKSLAPEAIDILRSRNGETLRFHGLAFARVRRLLNCERVWFGIDSANRRLLDDRSYSEWDKLVGDLITHRNAMTTDRYHAFYRAAPEAWLEFLLRRDITRLDPGLRIAPIHAQFRTSPASAGAARPVDLLALRHDGRLAVIELKVAEDRSHVLQGADYWRRVEAHRRCGNIQRWRLFDDAAIADVPPLVYLAAPMLSFHKAFDTLANAIAPDIKIYRFDLNEDWRSGVRVMRRLRANRRVVT